MGMEGNFNRRRFLQALGAAGAATVLPDITIHDTEAAQKKTPEKKIEKPYPIIGKLQFSEKNYKTVERTPMSNFRKLVPKLSIIRPKRPLMFEGGPKLSGRIEGANLVGTQQERQAGRIERSLRFKNITDAVELRYKLPPGLILAMVMQESYGADMYPNALNDGGIGLCHMQPKLSQEFGLETYKGNDNLRDPRHGRELRERIRLANGDVFVLAQNDDDRFNRVLNLDAVGRMLATWMHEPVKNRRAPKDPIDRALWRYSGRRSYAGRVKVYRAQLRDPKLLSKVMRAFDARNKDLKANGTKASERIPPYALYMETFWKENETGFDLAKYRKLPAYLPAPAGAL